MTTNIITEAGFFDVEVICVPHPLSLVCRDARCDQPARAERILGNPQQTGTTTLLPPLGAHFAKFQFFIGRE